MNLLVMSMLIIQFVVEFVLVKGLLRAVNILTSAIVESLRRRRGTRRLMIGYCAECNGFAAQILFGSSTFVLQLLLSTGIGWRKTSTRTMPSTLLHSGLNQFLLQVVLSEGSLGTRLETPHSSQGSQQMIST